MRFTFAMACVSTFVAIVAVGVAVGLIVRGPLERTDPCRHFYERALQMLDEAARSPLAESYHYGSAADMATIYLACRRSREQ